MLSKHACSEVEGSPTQKKKVRLNFTVYQPPPGSSIKICVKSEDGELQEIDECSPFNSQETQTTRFLWKTATSPSPPEGQPWTPPTPLSMADFIFRHVKNFLKYDGEDRLMKTSDDMKTLLKSGRTMKITKDARKVTAQTIQRRNRTPNKTKSNTEVTTIVDVTFSGGRITWRTDGGGRCGICKDGDCWKIQANDGACNEHANCYVTHFLVNDENNPLPTYTLLTTKPHATKFTHTLDGVLQTSRNTPTNYAAFCNYEEKQKEAKLSPKWKLVTPRPWIAKGLDLSKTFHQTTSVTLAIISTINSHEKNAANPVKFVRDRIFVDQVDWAVVKTILENSGFKLELGETSEYGEINESPLLKKDDLKWRDGDSWIYMKFGTTGRIYVGKVKQRNMGRGSGPMPQSFIHRSHPPTDKGIPLFQCEGDADCIEEETNKMESVGQLGVIFCEMLGGAIDGHPIKIDFEKYENLSEWEDRHVDRLKKLVGFWTSQKLEFTIPEGVDVSSINWEPLKNLYLGPRSAAASSKFDF
ncbi:uncharacterized protein LOC118438934 [Folsomia candida]|uniref:Uncharacterized protein n=1 Tax=Folsomia candida TaxID=158441 RepID=A0A226DAQ3_FOLCA|nr:uncharacterized protein LOC118438934 [Folsomia candida]OXA41691.1 hypothetical protein Fcan01_23515 [Folsomia candida]